MPIARRTTQMARLCRAWLQWKRQAIFGVGLRGTRKMWVRVVVAIVLLLLLAAAFGQTEKRIALLIGNQRYGSEIGRLANPHNDVARLEQALRGIRFDVVTARDVDLGTLTRVVNSYARRLHAAGPNAVGFFAILAMVHPTGSPRSSRGSR